MNCLQFQQVSRYVGCSLVATVGEARMRLFPNYFFWNQTMADAQGGTQHQHLLTNQRVTPVFRGRILHLS